MSQRSLGLIMIIIVTVQCHVPYFSCEVIMSSNVDPVNRTFFGIILAVSCSVFRGPINTVLTGNRTAVIQRLQQSEALHFEFK